MVCFGIPFKTFIFFSLFFFTSDPMFANPIYSPRHFILQGSDEDVFDHPPEVKDIIMFSFKKSTLFSKKKVTVHLL